MTGKLMLAAGLLTISAAVQNVSADTVPPPKPNAEVRVKIQPEEAGKIRDLKQQRKELLAKIQKRRSQLPTDTKKRKRRKSDQDMPNTTFLLEKKNLFFIILKLAC